jgi:hypothetical protein
VLKNGYIISFGDSHMVVAIQKGDVLEVKFIEGPKLDQQLYSIHQHIREKHTGY